MLTDAKLWIGKIFNMTSYFSDATENRFTVKKKKKELLFKNNLQYTNDSECQKVR